jgi:hypothetical protein
METVPGESVAVIGSIKQLGEWKDFRAGKMEWTEGHIWVLSDLYIPSESAVF